MDVPRYAPKRSFPPYRYRPGIDPHPTRDPRGHSHQRVARTPRPVTDATAATHDDFRFGVDLYNHAFFWEAHEVLEDLWHVAPPRSRERLLLQALIQAAAAQLKRTIADERGAKRLAALASEKLDRVIAGGSPFCAVDVAEFTERFRADLDGAGPFAALALS